MADQWLRRASLVVAAGTEGLELSELKFRFQTRQKVTQTPGNVAVRVYNLSEATIGRVEREFVRVILQAGYEGGEFGTIFDGTIVQVKRGRESAVDTYLDIIASDGDLAYCFATINSTLAKGASFRDRAEALRKASGIPEGHITDNLPGSKLPRGRVYFGMVRDHFRDFAFSTDTLWSIQRGMLQIIESDGYLPGEAVVLTSATGLVGLPEQTQDGIKVRCLLNPRIKPGVLVHIDNASIQQASIELAVSESATSANQLLPRATEDGLYRAIVVEHEGESRGQAWYTNVVCIAQKDGLSASLVKKGYS